MYSKHVCSQTDSCANKDITISLPLSWKSVQGDQMGRSRRGEWRWRNANSFWEDLFHGGFLCRQTKQQHKNL